MPTSVLVALVLLLQPTQQFDLVCAGEISSGADGLPYNKRPFEIRLRIDLDRMVWCENTCGTTPIKEANEAELVLAEVATAGGVRRRTAINRSSGAYLSSLNDPSMRNAFVHMTGQCTRAEFTPIPAAQF